MRASIPLILTLAGFISLGLPDSMLGVAWPSMREGYARPLDAIGALLLPFTAGYLLSSFSSGSILHRMSLGGLLALSAVLTGATNLAFGIAPAWTLLMIVSVIGGLGAGAIDSGLNAYAALHHSHATVNWMHAAYGIGAATSPVLLGEWLAHGGQWTTGYLVVGAFEVALGVAFLVTRRHWPNPPPPAPSTDAPPAGERLPRARIGPLQALRLRAVWIGIAAFFLYTGVEQAVGTWAFTLLTTRHGLAPDSGGLWVTIYWGAITVGRLFAGWWSLHARPERILVWSSAAILGSLLLMAANLGLLATGVGLVLAGLGFAPVFPLLISLTPARLPEGFTHQAMGFQIASAILGQSLVPSAVGVLAARAGVGVIPIACLVVGVLSVVATLLCARPVGGKSPGLDSSR